MRKTVWNSGIVLLFYLIVLLGVVSLPVPRVLLRRESLSYICDILLSDLCNKKVFIFVTSTIARLAKVYENSSVLLELLCDVVVDLSDQSTMKLNSLSLSLQQIKAKFDEKAPVSFTFSSLKASGSDSESSRAVSKIPVTLLPVGESGGRQHDRSVYFASI